MRIADQVYSVVGRIAMDQMVVDLGAQLPTGETLLGEEAVLFGAAENGDPSVDLWAAAAGTINYEVVTRIAPSVQRVYLNETPPEQSSQQGAE